jgi:hypothetical protein
MSEEPWFRPKPIGYGAGMPIHWKGWVLLGAYIGAVIAIPPLLAYSLGYPAGLWPKLGLIAAVTVPFIWIVKRKTAGGWRWRSGRNP